MGKSYVRIIQALALAAAVLGLLLTTPSIEARTRSHAGARTPARAKAQAKKSRTRKKSAHHRARKNARKKMKIVFDGNEPEAPQGELGDEIVQPRASDRQLTDSRTVVHLRGSSVDEIWEKSKKHHKADIAADDNPDLIEPVDFGEVEEPASARLNKPISIGSDPDLDETALGSFKTSSHKSAKAYAARPSRLASRQRAKSKSQLVAKSAKAERAVRKRDPIEDAFNPEHIKPQVAARALPVSHESAATVSMQTRPIAKNEAADALPESLLDFDDVKPVTIVSNRRVKQTVTARTTAPVPSKIYLRNIQPVVRPGTSALATNIRSRGADEPSQFTFDFAFENTTSLGRKFELETPGGRNFMMKNEVFVGAKHSSGWGARLAADYITTSNDDSAKDIREMGDPSIIIEHPSLYKSADVNVYGQARYYLPVATASKEAGLQHFAYYLFADLQLVEQLKLQNVFVPRYYLQSSYADEDAFSLLYDQTEVSKTFDGFRLGLGQRTQIESHQAISPGTSVELYPFADLLAISNTVLEAKLYVPLLANGVVNGAPGSPSGPSGTGVSNIQAEFFARLSF